MVSIQIQVREIIDVSGSAIIKAASIVDLLLISVATKMIRPEVTAFTICSRDSI